MSKEMVHSKLRDKKLNYIIENSTTYIIITKKPETDNDKVMQKDEPTTRLQPTKALAKPKTTVATILSLYQKENQQLKNKIIQLENKIDKLIDDKEQMLRDEMQKIEQVHKTKDNQLKTILELVNAKLSIDTDLQTVHEVEPVKTKEIEVKKAPQELVELRTYVKTLDTKSYQKKIIRKRFYVAADNDERIIKQNGKIYLDFSKYEYHDLLDF